jgi:hypothetical protein
MRRLRYICGEGVKEGFLSIIEEMLTCSPFAYLVCISYVPRYARFYQVEGGERDPLFAYAEYPDLLQESVLTTTTLSCNICSCSVCMYVLANVGGWLRTYDHAHDIYIEGLYVYILPYFYSQT